MGHAGPAVCAIVTANVARYPAARAFAALRLIPHGGSLNG